MKIYLYSFILGLLLNFSNCQLSPLGSSVDMGGGNTMYWNLDDQGCNYIIFKHQRCGFFILPR